MSSEQLAIDMEPWKNNPDTKITQLEVPLGLKRLEAVDKVTIYVARPTVPRGKFIMTTSDETGLLLFTSTEVITEVKVEGTPCSRFYIELLDAAKQQVLSLRRSKPTLTEWSSIQVRVGGVLVATVLEDKAKLHVCDASSHTVLEIGSPDDYKKVCEFNILSPKKEEMIGKISKLCGPEVQQDTNIEDYMITFPKDMDVKYKAAVLGACVLIDYMCYEEKCCE